MATFIASAPIDARAFDLYQFYKGATFSLTSDVGFRVTFSKDGYIDLKGFGYDYFLGYPYTGTTTSATVYIKGIASYTLKDISITQAQALKYLDMKPEDVNKAIFGGADTIIGSAFNDYLSGFGGADKLEGRGGNDTYFVDNGKDRVIEAVKGGVADNVLASVSYTLQAKQEVEILATTNVKGSAAINLTGNEFKNTLLGNAGDNRLDGGKQADVLKGFGGSDVYIVDSAKDQVFESVKDAGTDSILTSVSYKLAAGQSIEQLLLSDRASKAALDLTGNELKNSIKGNAGANVIDGGGGNDALYGFGGKDTFVFDSKIVSSKGVPIADNVAHIVDFSVVDDTITLAKAVFKGLTADVNLAKEFKTLTSPTTKLDGDDHILYNQKTGTLSYDADGSGKAGAVVFAVLDNKAALTFHDFHII